MHKKGRMAAKLRETRTAWLFLLPSIIGVTIFVLIPFTDVIRRSFFEALNNRFVGLDNYKQVFMNDAFKQAASNTARFLITCIPLLLILSLSLSMLIYNQRKFADLFKTTFLIPLAIPVASVVLLWQLFFHEDGLLNLLLSNFGIEAIDFMNSEKAFYVLVFSYLWKNIGYDMVLWLAGLNGISVSLYEAASVDGAGKLAKFFYITLPELKPTIFVTVILSFINSFKVFREAYLISGEYPHESIYMLQHTFNNWYVNLDIQKMCSAAVLYAFIVIIFILLLRKLERI